jgi:hypothetical protein
LDPLLLPQTRRPGKPGQFSGTLWASRGSYLSR